MKKLIAALCCLMLLGSPLALAQDKAGTTPKKEPTEAQKKQQERMKSCNATAGDKKLEGDARKKFMSSCLSGDTAGPSDKQKAQQQKMTDCNAQAGKKKLEGDARKSFMSSCLKG
jgi:Ni/Co efflux regulator RcnB